jgi:hypothetical protein
MNEFILETFSDICQKYDVKVRLKTKRTFQLIALEDIPLSEKEVIRGKVELIANKMGRKSYVIDKKELFNPVVFNLNLEEDEEVIFNCQEILLFTTQLLQKY